MPIYSGVTSRHLQAEMMDQPDLDADQHRRALRGLGRINFWSRSAGILWKPLRDFCREVGRPLRVLDVATGGGDVVCRLALTSRRANLPIQFAGCDVSSVAVDYAKQQAHRAGVEVDFFIADALNDALPAGFDIITSSLFLHHLTEDQAALLLGKMAERANSMILVNDLLRSSLGLVLAHVGTRLLTTSHIVHYDGPRSVKGAFTLGEIHELAARAGLEEVTVVKRWPQRFLLSWQKE